MRVKHIFALVLMFFAKHGYATEGSLTIVSTLSSESVSHITKTWQKQSDVVTVHTISKNSTFLKKLVNSSGKGNADIILTASPMLIRALRDNNQLVDLREIHAPHQEMVPENIRDSAIAIGYSGFGILSNNDYLEARNILPPDEWADLTAPEYQDTLITSSPARSDTTTLMVEFLLQSKGWMNGWETLMASSPSLITISSRSFDVVDKVQSGRGGIGLVTENNVTDIEKNTPLSFHYFPYSPALPIYIAVLQDGRNNTDSLEFVNFLLGPRGQSALAGISTNGFFLAPGNPEQRALFLQSPLNVELAYRRQKMLQVLFDAAISNQLGQIKDIWREVHLAESRLQHSLPEVRALLSTVPVSQEQSEDIQYLRRFEDNVYAQQQRVLWQLWFKEQQRLAMVILDTLQK
ncbi:ABC transporter substrate-binding protein [Citrobacter portucalensis]|uniref:ABC transporter substrate-binding protein n=1 Tax=Citrobacter portucalensis TaxID=1639133 RepID=UPI001C640C4E|nr:ABC transporter substrate-binding protein [Citrobacter portucalensis]MBW7639357.1 ABC transporter substrate-binding protein [Citrobacter portucalensis]MCA2133696.1 ABC transporter substrate-binding protein [Citrobacter portucalensis]MCA2144120.1 ABC transporter substrate-binding protein [Citrobacter portucalensis]MCA2148785.1 ABC transporter substrate-binding protein [Citrobacter portucalensis]MDX7638683.1 ABC transporter substrate-binding protein [Citrobacter portucalensis]